MAIEETAANAAANFGSAFITGIYWVIWVFIIALIVFFLFRTFRWNVTIYEYKDTNSGLIKIKKKGRENKDRTGKVIGFEIKGDRKYSGRKIPEQYFMLEKSLFGYKTVVHMAYDDDANLRPIKPMRSADLPEWTALSNPEMEVYTNIGEQMDSRYDLSSLWEKYGQIIMMAGLAAIMLVSFFFAWDQVNGVIETASQATAVCNNAMETARSICTGAAESTVPGGVI